jgi:glycosyltransferase involved in cell wall biosynthesis
MNTATGRALFLQVCDAAAYPPLMNASALMAEAGWNVTVLSSPVAGSALAMLPHPRIAVETMPARPSFVVSKPDFVRYCLNAVRLARSLAPDLVYASDPLGAVPGIAAAAVAGSRLVYHEHDSPNRNADLNPVLRLGRRRALATADLVVFPNAERAEAAAADCGLDTRRTRIVWNLPRRDEVPRPETKPPGPVVVYYHGTINPERLPMSVPAAVAQFGGHVVLRIAGYEAGSSGYVAALEAAFGRSRDGGIIDHIGQVPLRKDLIREAQRADVGLSLMPANSGDINMRCMTGASNKAFDCMAAGLPLIVSDLPDWRRMFVEPGYALPVDPRSQASIAAAIATLVERPDLRRDMGEGNRRKIEFDWNYDTAFAPLLAGLGPATAPAIP